LKELPIRKIVLKEEIIDFSSVNLVGALQIFAFIPDEGASKWV